MNLGLGRLASNEGAAAVWCDMVLADALVDKVISWSGAKLPAESRGRMVGGQSV